MDDKKESCKRAEEEKVVATALGGHEPEQFSTEGYEKSDHSDLDCCKEKNADSEGHVDKLAGQCEGDDRQSTFVDDKEYLASSGGGRSFQYADELTNEDERTSSTSTNDSLES
ncbi:hypothetical protein KF913_08300 [Candidatus Obscuribacterales bacterium]|nr:hypothetical protein [Candidatus Obscuribacterales bacterium]